MNMLVGEQCIGNMYNYSQEPENLRKQFRNVLYRPDSVYENWINEDKLILARSTVAIFPSYKSFKELSYIDKET